MSNGEIRSFQDLLDEEQRVLMEYKRSKKDVMDALMRIDYFFKPVEQMLSNVNKWCSIPPSKQFLPRMIDMALDIISRKILFKHVGWLKRFLGSFAIRTAYQFVMDNLRQRRKPGPQEGTEDTQNQ